MPELPEVEPTRRGIAPYVERKKVERVIVRSAKPPLRRVVPHCAISGTVRGNRATSL